MNKTKVFYEDHTNIRAKYYFATEMLPVLRKEGYSTMLLESLPTGVRIDAVISGKMRVINEFKTMCEILKINVNGLKNLTVSGYTKPELDQFEIVKRCIIKEITASDERAAEFEHDLKQKYPRHDPETFLEYAVTAISIVSDLHLYRQLIQLGFSICGLEDPENHYSLARMQYDDPQSFTDDYVRRKSPQREAFFKQVLCIAEQQQPGKVLLLMGAEHNKFYEPKLLDSFFLTTTVDEMQAVSRMVQLTKSTKIIYAADPSKHELNLSIVSQPRANITPQVKSRFTIFQPLGGACQIRLQLIPIGIGAQVRITGLVQRSDLNGSDAAIIGTLNQNGRLPIKVGDEKILVNPKNIESSPKALKKIQDSDAKCMRLAARDADIDSNRQEPSPYNGLFNNRNFVIAAALVFAAAAASWVKYKETGDNSIYESYRI